MNKKLTKEEFIEKAKKIHGDKYDYSKVELTGNNKTKVCIICPEHGEFWQKQNAHLCGQGCQKCYGNKKLTKEEFIEKAKQIHGEKYDYSKVEYKNNHTKVCIICPEHGEFWQLPSSHLQGHACQKCSLKKLSKINSLGLENFIKKAKKVHGDKYDYSKVNYINNKTKVCIICPEHGEFWQKPNDHLNGCGCQICSLYENIQENKLFELLVKKFSILVERQKKFKWLKHINLLKLDFYLPDYNIAIEYQGEQHFEKYRFENDCKQLTERKKRDLKKIELCEKNGVKLFHFSFSKKIKNDNKYYLITDFEELIKKINEYISKKQSNQ